jgi:hypothetical protein
VPGRSFSWHGQIPCEYLADLPAAFPFSGTGEHAFSLQRPGMILRWQFPHRTSLSKGWMAWRSVSLVNSVDISAGPTSASRRLCGRYGLAYSTTNIIANQRQSLRFVHASAKGCSETFGRVNVDDVAFVDAHFPCSATTSYDIMPSGSRSVFPVNVSLKWSIFQCTRRRKMSNIPRDGEGSSTRANDQRFRSRIRIEKQ